MEGFGGSVVLIAAFAWECYCSVRWVVVVEDCFCHFRSQSFDLYVRADWVAEYEYAVGVGDSVVSYAPRCWLPRVADRCVFRSFGLVLGNAYTMRAGVSHAVASVRIFNRARRAASLCA